MESELSEMQDEIMELKAKLDQLTTEIEKQQ